MRLTWVNEAKPRLLDGHGETELDGHDETELDGHDETEPWWP